jgi:hypothetical protein
MNSGLLAIARRKPPATVRAEWLTSVTIQLCDSLHEVAKT